MKQRSNHWGDVVRGEMGNSSCVLNGRGEKKRFALSYGDMAGTGITIVLRGLASFLRGCRNNLSSIRCSNIKPVMQATQAGQLEAQQTNQPDDDELTNCKSFSVCGHL